MESGNDNGEPSTAPEPNRWYDITMGHSLKDTHSYSPRFCTLRYEFKPASIDDTQPGSLHKSKDNRVKVEFQNNQHGKPKVSFEGVSEDYKDKEKDAILFFDGESFRLEKLNRAVKGLRYVRVPGESAPAPIPTTSVGPVTELYPPLATKATKVVPPVSDTIQPVKVIEIDINNPVNLEHENEEEPNSVENPLSTLQNSNAYESEEDVNIDDDEDDNDGQRVVQMENTLAKEFGTGGLDIDINLPHPVVIEDDEIADVDINDDESYKGLNAAEALRAQVNAEAREEEQSSSSSSGGESGSESTESGSESSGSGSGSSSSESSSGSESGSPSESGSHANL